MAQSYKILGQGAPVYNPTAAIYTVPAGYQAVISSIVVKSGDWAPGQFYVFIVKAGQTASTNANVIYDIPNTTANTTYSFSDGITLGAGDKIFVQDYTSGEGAGIVHVFGCEMSV